MTGTSEFPKYSIRDGACQASEEKVFANFWEFYVLLMKFFQFLFLS